MTSDVAIRAPYACSRQQRRRISIRRAAECRTPGVYPFPRDTGGHVGFGHGAHHRLGAPLARMELQVALTARLQRFPNLDLAGTGDDLTWKTGVATRGPSRMLVRW